MIESLVGLLVLICIVATVVFVLGGARERRNIKKIEGRSYPASGAYMTLTHAGTELFFVKVLPRQRTQ
jgi:hypothetical protein